MLEQLTQDYLWMRTLNSQAPDAVTSKLVAANKQFDSASSTAVTAAAAPAAAPAAAAAAAASSSGSSRAAVFSRFARGDESMTAAAATGGTPSAGGGGVGGMLNPLKTKEWTKAVNQLVDAASDQLGEASLQRTKEQVFS